jgi:hypothetical protein
LGPIFEVAATEHRLRALLCKSKSETALGLVAAALFFLSGQAFGASSVTPFPGYMWEPTPAKHQTISKVCVFMYVGENDEYRWHSEMQGEAEFLRAKGSVAHYTLEKGQPYRLGTLADANAGRFLGRPEVRLGVLRMQKEVRRPAAIISVRTGCQG